MTWLFLLAYTCSGLAGLIYQVTWTRLLTLYPGHSTAAASSVVAGVADDLARVGALEPFDLVVVCWRPGGTGSVLCGRLDPD